MRYMLLGPVAACGERAPIPVGGPRNRSVLAVLAMNADVGVTVVQLIEAVWEGAAPATADKQIQMSVSALRRGLGQAVVTVPGGYLLRADRDEVDLFAFEDQVARARAGAADGRLEVSASLMRDALAGWQGAPLGGVRGLTAATAKLEELRLAVHEECLEAELALGRHIDTVAELADLVVRYPMRERMRGLLMLALYRCGRQAEALDTFRAWRGHLVDQLGLEPGEALQDLHQQILARDRALDLCPRAPARASVSEPDSEQRVTGPIWWYDPPKPVPPTLFGVTISSTSGAMPDFRVGAVRLWNCRTRWANVEPAKGSFDWTVLDRLVTGAERARLPVLYTMGMPSGWACPDGKRGIYNDDARAAPPADLADWEAYVRAVVRRFQGRVEAYELWDSANLPFGYNGSVGTLAALTSRASRVIRRYDPDATVVAPSFGNLWDESAREFLEEFARSGGYEHCDVASVKLHPRTPDGAPEEMVELAHLINTSIHKGGAGMTVWSCGGAHHHIHAPRLSESQANAFAVRKFLASLNARYDRLYFYSWGSPRLPLVLQGVGGEPTQAAYYVERLQAWLTNAYLRSCCHGRESGLPENAWQLRLAFRRSPDTWDEAMVCWTEKGTATLEAEPGARWVEYLDGSVQPLRTGRPLRLTELPMLIRYRTGSRGS